MDEETALELYKYFTGEKYDLVDKASWLSSLEDPQTASELYDYFDGEGYELGDKKDFILSSASAEKKNQQQTPTPTGEEQEMLLGDGSTDLQKPSLQTPSNLYTWDNEEEPASTVTATETTSDILPAGSVYTDLNHDQKVEFLEKEKQREFALLDRLVNPFELEEQKTAADISFENKEDIKRKIEREYEDKKKIASYSVTSEEMYKDYAQQAKELRPVDRDNTKLLDYKEGEGEVSSHLMATEYIDGQWVSFPTLFPKDPNNQSSDPQDWDQISDPVAAYEEAKSRGEVFEFGQDKDSALEFKEGGWKKDKVKEAEEKVEPSKYAYLIESTKKIQKKMKDDPWASVKHWGRMIVEDATGIKMKGTYKDKEFAFADNPLSKRDKEGKIIPKEKLEDNEYEEYKRLTALRSKMKALKSGMSSSIAGPAILKNLKAVEKRIAEMENIPENYVLSRVMDKAKLTGKEREEAHAYLKQYFGQEYKNKMHGIALRRNLAAAGYKTPEQLNDEHAKVFKKKLAEEKPELARISQVITDGISDLEKQKEKFEEEEASGSKLFMEGAMQELRQYEKELQTGKVYDRENRELIYVTNQNIGELYNKKVQELTFKANELQKSYTKKRTRYFSDATTKLQREQDRYKETVNSLKKIQETELPVGYKDAYEAISKITYMNSDLDEKALKQEQWAALSLDQKASQALTTGVLDVASMVTGLTTYMSPGLDLASTLTHAIKERREGLAERDYSDEEFNAQDWTPDFMQSKFTTLDFWITAAGEQAPIMIPLIKANSAALKAFSKTVGKMKGAKSKVVRDVTSWTSSTLKPWQKTSIEHLVGAGASRGIESVMEGMAHFNHMMEMGYSYDESKESADNIVRKNQYLILGDAIQSYLIFGRRSFLNTSSNYVPKGMGRNIRVGGGLSTTMAIEGGEEVVQEGWAAQETDPLLTLMDFAGTDMGKEVFIIGSAFGGGFYTAGHFKRRNHLSGVNKQFEKFFDGMSKGDVELQDLEARGKALSQTYAMLLANRTITPQEHDEAVSALGLVINQFKKTFTGDLPFLFGDGRLEQYMVFSNELENIKAQVEKTAPGAERDFLQKKADNLNKELTNLFENPQAHTYKIGGVVVTKQEFDALFSDPENVVKLEGVEAETSDPDSRKIMMSFGNNFKRKQIARGKVHVEQIGEGLGAEHALVVAQKELAMFEEAAKEEGLSDNKIRTIEQERRAAQEKVYDIEALIAKGESMETFIEEVDNRNLKTAEEATEGEKMDTDQAIREKQNALREENKNLSEEIVEEEADLLEKEIKGEMSATDRSLFSYASQKKKQQIQQNMQVIAGLDVMFSKRRAAEGQLMGAPKMEEQQRDEGRVTEETVEEETTEREDTKPMLTINELKDDEEKVLLLNGEKGKLREDGQALVFETNTTIHELGNKDEVGAVDAAEFGIEVQEELAIEINDDKSVTIDGKRFTNPNESEMEAVEKTNKGYSVTLVDEAGKKKTIRGQRAEHIAYQYHLKQFDNEEKINRAEKLADEAIKLEEQTRETADKEKVRAAREVKPTPAETVEPVEKQAEVSPEMKEVLSLKEEIDDMQKNKKILEGQRNDKTITEKDFKHNNARLDKRIKEAQKALKAAEKKLTEETQLSLEEQEVLIKKSQLEGLKRNKEEAEKENIELLNIDEQIQNAERELKGAEEKWAAKKTQEKRKDWWPEMKEVVSLREEIGEMEERQDELEEQRNNKTITEKEFNLEYNSLRKKIEKKRNELNALDGANKKLTPEESELATLIALHKKEIIQRKRRNANFIKLHEKNLKNKNLSKEDRERTEEFVKSLKGEDSQIIEREKKIKEAEKRVQEISLEKKKAKAELAKRKETTIVEETKQEEKSDPATDRKKGFRMRGGKKISRPKKIANKIIGKAKEVVFGKDPRSGKEVAAKHEYTVIEANDLQPSHMQGSENEKFFLNEAQPRDRDKGAYREQDVIKGEELNPERLGMAAEAYVGAPVVNQRGEVIQGNGRAAAIKWYYKNKPNDQTYKEWLAENGVIFGLNAKQIEQMQEMENPVLVRMTKESDKNAIKLGNMSSDEIEDVSRKGEKERAGVKRIDPQGKTKLVNIILENTSEEQTLRDVIRRNGAKVLTEMINLGMARTEQRSNFITNAGNLNTDGVSFVENSLKAMFFEGTVNEDYTVLDDVHNNIKKGIERAMVALLGASENKALNNEISKVATVLADYTKFKKSNPKTNIKSFLDQLRIDNTTVRSELSEVEQNLIEYFMEGGVKGKVPKQKQIADKLTEYVEATKPVAKSLFKKASDGMSKEDAVKEVFKKEEAPAQEEETIEEEQTEEIQEEETVEETMEEETPPVEAGWYADISKKQIPGRYGGNKRFDEIVEENPELRGNTINPKSKTSAKEVLEGAKEITNETIGQATPEQMFLLGQFSHPNEYGFKVSRAAMLKEFEKRGKEIMEALGLPTDPTYPIYNSKAAGRGKGTYWISNIEKILYYQTKLPRSEKDGDRWWAVVRGRAIKDIPKAIEMQKARIKELEDFLAEKVAENTSKRTGEITKKWEKSGERSRIEFHLGNLQEELEYLEGYKGKKTEIKTTTEETVEEEETVKEERTEEEIKDRIAFLKKSKDEDKRIKDAEEKLKRDFETTGYKTQEQFEAANKTRREFIQDAKEEYDVEIAELEELLAAKKKGTETKPTKEETTEEEELANNQDFFVNYWKEQIEELKKDYHGESGPIEHAKEELRLAEEKKKEKDEPKTTQTKETQLAEIKKAAKNQKADDRDVKRRWINILKQSILSFKQGLEMLESGDTRYWEAVSNVDGFGTKDNWIYGYEGKQDEQAYIFMRDYHEEYYWSIPAEIKPKTETEQATADAITNIEKRALEEAIKLTEELIAEVEKIRVKTKETVEEEEAKPTEEETQEQEELDRLEGEIEFAEGQIEDFNEEIKNTKENFNEDKAKIIEEKNKKIKELQAKKKKAKTKATEEKIDEEIEDVKQQAKADIEDAMDERDGYIESYKDDISIEKSDIRKAKKAITKIKKKQTKRNAEAYKKKMHEEWVEKNKAKPKPKKTESAPQESMEQRHYSAREEKKHKNPPEDYGVENPQETSGRSKMPIELSPLSPEEVEEHKLLNDNQVLTTSELQQKLEEALGFMFNGLKVVNKVFFGGSYKSGGFVSPANMKVHVKDRKDRHANTHELAHSLDMGLSLFRGSKEKNGAFDEELENFWNKGRASMHPAEKKLRKKAEKKLQKKLQREPTEDEIEEAIIDDVKANPEIIQYRRMEAFAEILSYWMINPDKTTSMAPKTIEYLKEKILAQKDGTKRWQALEAVSYLIRLKESYNVIDQAKSDMAKSQTAKDLEGGWEKLRDLLNLPARKNGSPDLTIFGKLQYFMTNEKKGLKEAEKTLKMLLDINEEEYEKAVDKQLYLQTVLMSGKNEKAREFLENSGLRKIKVVDGNIEFEVVPDEVTDQAMTINWLLTPLRAKEEVRIGKNEMAKNIKDIIEKIKVQLAETQEKIKKREAVNVSNIATKTQEELKDLALDLKNLKDNAKNLKKRLAKAKKALKSGKGRKDVVILQDELDNAIVIMTQQRIVERDNLLEAKRQEAEEDFETAFDDLQYEKDYIEKLRRDLATEQNKNYSPQTPTPATRAIKEVIEEAEVELKKAQKAYDKAKKAKKTAIKKQIDFKTKEDVDNANVIVNAFENGDTHSKSQQGRIIEFARRYRAMADLNMQYARDTGLLSEEAYEEIKENNQYYVNMMRVMDTENITGFGGDVVKTYTGSDRELMDQTEALIASFYSIQSKGDANYINLGLTELLKGNPKTATPTSSFGYKIEGNDAPKKGFLEMKVWRDGKLEKWAVAEDLAKSMPSILELASAKASQIALVNRYMNYMTLGMPVLTKGVQQSITTFPVFARVVNPVRDWWHRNVITRTGQGLEIPFATTLSEEMSDLADYFGVPAKALGMIGVTPKDFRLTDEKALEMYNVYGGGQAGYDLYMKSETHYHRALFRGMHQVANDGGMVLSFENFRDWSSDWLSKGEIKNRLKEFKSAYAKFRKEGHGEGAAAKLAAFESRDLMDFAIKGRAMHHLGHMIPFFNATVQGSKRTIKFMMENKGNPEGWARFGVYMALPSMLVRMLANAWGYEDDYEQLPDWQRNLFWNFKLPGTDMDWFISIPKPFELGVIGSAFDRLEGKFMYGEEDAFDGYLGAVARSFIAIDPISGRDWGESFKNTALQITGGWKPAIEVMANWDSFRKTPITHGKQKMDTEHIRDTHPEKAVDRRSSNLSRWIQKAIGADRRNIDHIIKGWFGYYANHALKLSNEFKRVVPAKASQTYGGLSPRTLFESAKLGRSFGPNQMKSVHEFYEQITFHNKYRDKEVSHVLGLIRSYDSTKEVDGKSPEEQRRYIEFASKILTDWLETGNQYFQEWSKGERKSIIKYRTDGSKYEVDLSDFYNIVKNNKDPRTSKDYVKNDGTPYTEEEKSEMSDYVKKGIMEKSTVENMGTQFQRMLENWKSDNNKK